MLRALVIAVSIMLSSAAWPQQLVVGTATQTTSIDPHFQLAFTNLAFARHVYEPLFAQDERQQLHPALALSWEPLSPTLWRIRLRAGVHFHDGSPFTADDVAFTLARAPDVPNSPASFALYTRAIAAVTVLDPLTVEIRTDAPRPTLPMELSTVGIISRRAAEGARTADFNSGRAAIGTGPFRFVEWTPGERIVLTRNPNYWGPAPAWERVVFRVITNDSARSAALISGDVDIIEAVPAAMLERVRARADLASVGTPGNRLLYLAMDQAAEVSANALAPTGTPLARNPFRDVRVRRAVSLAIDRAALADRVMHGAATPAGQVLPPGYTGVHPAIGPDPFDPARARALLNDAGFGDGFATTLIAPNDRYPNDEQLAQAVAQMLARVGIRVRVEATPGAVVLQRASRGEFGLMMWGITSETGETTSSLRSLLVLPGSRLGGQANRGRYSNPEVDGLLERSVAEMDLAARASLIDAVSEIAARDVAFISLVYPQNIWAMRRTIAYRPRSDGYTLAMDVRPAASP